MSQRIWFKQRKGWGLGNFIMATPMLASKAELVGYPVGVMMHDKNLWNIFQDCPFIERIDVHPGYAPFACTCRPNKVRRGESDYEAYLRIHTRKKLADYPPYVDRVGVSTVNMDPTKRYVALMHGCYFKPNLEKKNLGTDMLQYVIDMVAASGAVPVVVMGGNDYKWYWSKVKNLGKCIVSNNAPLREALGIIQGCNYFISNDTGFAHAAGASSMKGIVVWKDTPFGRCREPSRLLTHIRTARLTPQAIKSMVRATFENALLDMGA